MVNLVVHKVDGKKKYEQHRRRWRE